MYVRKETTTKEKTNTFTDCIDIHLMYNALYILYICDRNVILIFIP